MCFELSNLYQKSNITFLRNEFSKICEDFLDAWEYNNFGK